MGRRWLDFRYGHSIYLIFLLSFSNFILISYRLLIEKSTFLADLFSNLWIFILVFILGYIPIAIIVGVWHRKNQIRIDTEVGLRQNPLLLKILKIIIDLQRGKANKKDVESMCKLLDELK